MIRPVQWSRHALDDLKAQIVHIAAENSLAAKRVADRVGDTANAIGEMATGRPGRVSGTYEKIVVGLPYIIAYSITVEGERETISVLRVIHTSRDWPDEEWPGSI
ncbi:type II toxin-antitoxin system RelE/ParE family toxin [Pararhizobium sp. LjRoot235]